MQPTPFFLQKATVLAECINTFSVVPLRGKDYDTMFCDTHEARTGEANSNPIDELIDYYGHAQGIRHTLVVGHTGCGKSTELHTFVRAMQEEKRLVVDVSAKDKLDLQSVTYIDLLVMIMAELCIAAKNEKLSIRDSVVKEIRNYWNKTTMLDEVKGTSLGVEVQAGIEGDVKLPGLVRFFGKVSGALTSEAITRKKIQTVIEPELSVFMDLLRMLAGEVEQQLAKKGRPRRPILVIDDLDKMDRDKALNIFHVHASTLALLPMNSVCTFPIDLAYAPEFNPIQNTFEHVILPMIKLYDWQPKKTRTYRDERYEKGWETLRAIIFKRAEENLFACDALDLMIEKPADIFATFFA